MKIPLQIKKIPPDGYHIFVKGKIAGVSMQFLLDTGASKSVIDSTFAGKHFPYMISRMTEHQTTGLGASIANSEFTRLGRVRIGDFKVGRVEFALLDLSIVNGAYLEAGLDPVVAIIGGDLLKKFGAVIHYSDKTIELK